jgi:hypothetical protein
MSRQLLKMTIAAAIAFAPVASWSQTNSAYTAAQTATTGDKDSPKMQKPGKIQKETNPRKNGTTQSQSTNGMNKNGQPQQ